MLGCQTYTEDLRKAILSFSWQRHSPLRRMTAILEFWPGRSSSSAGRRYSGWACQGTCEMRYPVRNKMRFYLSTELLWVYTNSKYKVIIQNSPLLNVGCQHPRSLSNFFAFRCCSKHRIADPPSTKFRSLCQSMACKCMKYVWSALIVLYAI